MDKRTYDFLIGLIMVVLSVVFLLMPTLLDMDGFIPFMLSLMSLLFGIAFFMMGIGNK